ncbi:MAG TPA: hypothetical protein VIV64_00385 [Gammaproteobacteria bacterium]|jgi:hypothetical protein
MQETDTPEFTDDNNAYGFGISSPNSTGWNGGVSGNQIEENFDPAVGFVNETGIRSLSSELGYRWRFGGDRMIRTIQFSTNASRTELLETGLLDRQDSRVRVSVTTRNQDSIFLNFSSNKENIPFNFPIYRPSNVFLDPSDPSYPSDYDPQDPCASTVVVCILRGSYSWDSVSLGMRTGEQRKVSAFFSFTTGDYYDGESKNINSNISWRPSRKLSISGGYSLRDVDLPGGSFQVRQSDLSVSYAFSSTLSWVNLIQYDNFSEVIGFNSRLHWIPEAGREGFIVFNHNVRDRDKNDSFHSIDADVSVKFSYTLRY